MAVAKATTSSSVTADMVTTTKASEREENCQNPNPILSFFSNFLKIFKLPPLPCLSPQQHQAIDKSVPAASDVVSFPGPDLAPGKLGADVVQVRETQPHVVWQAYAIGGILVVRWAWMQWNERKSRKPPNDTPPPICE